MDSRFVQLNTGIPSFETLWDSVDFMSITLNRKQRIIFAQIYETFHEYCSAFMLKDGIHFRWQNYISLMWEQREIHEKSKIRPRTEFY